MSVSEEVMLALAVIAGLIGFVVLVGVFAGQSPAPSRPRHKFAIGSRVTATTKVNGTITAMTRFSTGEVFVSIEPFDNHVSASSDELEPYIPLTTAVDEVEIR